LLIQRLNLRAQFPIRLRPETEQELATALWQTQLNAEILRSVGVSESRLIRRILDLLQLAAYSGTPTEEIKSVLAQGLFQPEDDATNGATEIIERSPSLLLQWRSWCLERGITDIRNYYRTLRTTLITRSRLPTAFTRTISIATSG
jgi:hypothetical protein